MNLNQQSHDSLVDLQQSLQKQYNEFTRAGLSLDLTRGKPSARQLDLSNDLDGIINGEFVLQDGTDVRNYGGLAGIPGARQLGGELLAMDPQHEMVCGNSSLTFMYQYIVHAMLNGVNGRESCWASQANESASPVGCRCPVPGDDRPFTIC